MKFNLWSPQEVEVLLAGLHKNLTPEEISNKINNRVNEQTPGFHHHRTPEAVIRKTQRIKRLKTKDQPIPLQTQKLIPVGTTQDPIDEDGYDHFSVDLGWDKLKSIQERYQEHSKFLSTGVIHSTNGIKILVLSDIHFPFARIDFLKQALKEHIDADIVVLNGDIFDGYIFSSFEKDQAVAAIDEYNCVLEFVEYLSKNFKYVVITSGNHEERFPRTLKKVLPKDGLSLFSQDLLARIANGEKLNREGLVVEKLNFKNVYYPETERWWVQIGKTLFIHPHSKGSSKPGFTVSGWAEKFRQRLPVGSFDSVVCGHTHQCYKGIQSGLLLIEQGCLCDYMSYSWKPNVVYHSTAAQGYAVIYQDKEGNTDFNRSGFIYLGALLPVDKPIFNSLNNTFRGAK